MAITIKLQESSFKPGETIAGNINWELESAPLPRQIKVRLVWITEGKSTQDKMYCDESVIQPSSTTGTFAFTLKLPLFPWSYQGKLFSVQWMIITEADNKEINHVIINYGPDKTPIKA